MNQNLTNTNLPRGLVWSDRIGVLNLDRSSANQMSIKNCEFHGLRAIEADLQNLHVHDTILVGSLFEKARLIAALITNSSLISSNLSEAMVTNPTFSECLLNGTNFSRAKVKASTPVIGELSSENFQDCNFEFANLTNAEFQNIWFDEVNFTFTDMRSAVFDNCMFTNCAFTNTRMNATFIGSNFCGCSFVRPNLSQASFLNVAITNTLVFDVHSSDRLDGLTVSDSPDLESMLREIYLHVLQERPSSEPH